MNARALALCLPLLSGCGILTRNAAQWGHEPRLLEHKIHDPRTSARLAVLWIGHATVLVQMGDRFVLTDPVFTKSVGELSPRLVEPGLDPADLPPLAAVVVSHMHFDHLSFDSLGMIEDRTRVLLLPPGARSSVPKYAFESRELDRWETYESMGVRITAVPVRHVGGRYGIDQAWNPRAFTGYVFEHDGMTVYFGGDTAYDPPLFRAAHERFPHIDLALLPICPDRPRDFMQSTHMDPGQALLAFGELSADRMVPIHFGTFVNSDDGEQDCPLRLREEMGRLGVADARVPILAIGEQRVILP